MTITFDDFFSPVTDTSGSDQIQGISTGKENFDDFFSPVKEVSRTRSLLSAFPKGIIKAAQSISPLPNFGPVPEELGAKVTEQFLPTKKKLPEELLERGGKLATYLAGGEGGIASKILRTGAGTLAGQATKELGGGKLAQDIAELSSMSLPDLSKNIPAKKSQERVLSFLRGKGFSENEIAPLLQSPKSLARFANFASKGEKTNKLMRDTYQKFENVYSSIRDEGSRLPGLSEKNYNNFSVDFNEKLSKIPKMYRRLMKEEIEDLENSAHTFSDFIDFNQAVNARIKGVSGGKAALGILKGPIEKAQKLLSPELANDYQLANDLYRKRIDVANHLKTNQIADILDLGEIAGAAGAIADQNLGMLTKVLGVTQARKVARELLINPRLQNISLRMLNAAKKNKIPELQKIYESFKKESPKGIREDLP